MSASKQAGPQFSHDTFKRLFESLWPDPSIRIRPEVLALCAEYMRLMTDIATKRAIKMAENDQSPDLNEQHLRKVMIQMLLDFR